jgi:hypothetical protein
VFSEDRLKFNLKMLHKLMLVIGFLQTIFEKYLNSSIVIIPLKEVKMRRIILILILTIFIIGCSGKINRDAQTVKENDNPSNQNSVIEPKEKNLLEAGGQPGDYLCKTDQECAVDKCQGCISKSGIPRENCVISVPDSCYCENGLCQPRFGRQESVAMPPRKEKAQPQEGQDEFNLPDIEAPKTLKAPPVRSQDMFLKMNNVKIKYPSIVPSYSPTTMGADLLITINNTGQNTEIVHMIPLKELLAYVPQWNIHFFAFQDDTIKLKPGEIKTLHWFSSNDNIGEFNVKIDFWQKTDKSDKVTADIKFYNGESKLVNQFGDSILYGYLKDKNTNKPVEFADITVNIFSGRQNFRTSSDSNGMYAIAVPSIDQITSLFGENKAYSSFADFLTINVGGYEYFYQGGIALKPGEKKRLDIYLEPMQASKNYTLKWENKVSDYYGFFWVLTDDNWKYIVGSQAKHTPQLDKPTNFYLFDAATGKQMWKEPTGNECWGIDITKNGSMVAAGCHDNYVYVVSTNDGNLKWKKDGGVMNREVKFSHDGKYLVTGPADNYDLILYNSADGSILRKIISSREALRNAEFTLDDSKFVAGFSFGWTAMFNINGDKLWEDYIGEFPLFLAVDNKDNTYTSGKGRTLFSFDPNGNTRWSYRVPDHTAGTGSISSDGSRVVIGTVGGWLYYFDGSNGNVLWEEKLPCTNAGHNAVSMSSDGKYIAVGCGPEYKFLVYNEKGTKIYEYDSTENPDPILNAKWATIGAEASDGTQKGIMGTYTSADGSKIVAGYGDNYIREFAWQ